VRLAEFALLTDENIHPQVVAFLRNQGFHVLDVKEGSLVGSSDSSLLRLATSERRVLVTHDRDVGRVAVSLLEPGVGIVYLRPGHIKPQFTIESLRALFQQDLQVSPPFIIVVHRVGEEINIRVRFY